MNYCMEDDVNRIINNGKKSFIDRIEKDTRYGSKAIIFNKADYPIFRPASDLFYKYQHHEEIMEWAIRNYLINQIFVELFKYYNIKCWFPSEKSRVIRTNYSNEEYGKQHSFSLIIKKNGQYIGYRYSELSASDEEYMEVLRRYPIHHIEIIDWSDTDSLKSYRQNYVFRDKKVVRYTTLHKFFLDYFSEDVFRTYINVTRKAVQEAKELIGYQTIPRMSLKNLFLFKKEIEKQLSHLSIESFQYRDFNTKSGELTNQVRKPLSNEEDINIINKRVFSDGLYRALIGKNKHAVCFMTAEYQYHIFREGTNHSFDYSAVVVGYYKAVELLLEVMMEQTLHQPESNDLQILSKYKRKKIPFTKENKKEFSIVMDSLIKFIDSNGEGWYVSKEGKTEIINQLLNYKQGCRNEHLHKDTIEDIETVEVIRTNSLLCLFYLLGAYRYTDDIFDDELTLGAERTEYNRLYEALLQMPSSISDFYIQFDDSEEIKAIRLRDQEEIRYDERGNILSTVQFGKVNSFGLRFKDYQSYYSWVNSLVEKDQIITISPKNVPTKMFWENCYCEKIGIDWK